MSFARIPTVVKVAKPWVVGRAVVARSGPCPAFSFAENQEKKGQYGLSVWLLKLITKYKLTYSGFHRVR